MYYLILKHTIIKSWHLGDDDQPLNTCKYVNAHCISPPRPLEKEHVYNLELRYLEICYHNILTSAGPTLKHLPEIASLCPGLDTSPTCWWRHHLHHHCHRHHHHSHHNQDHHPHLKNRKRHIENLPKHQMNTFTLTNKDTTTTNRMQLHIIFVSCI